MKTFKKNLTELLTIWLILYLCGSFIAASFDIQYWGTGTRFWLGVIGILLAFSAFGAFESKPESKKRKNEPS